MKFNRGSIFSPGSGTIGDFVFVRRGGETYVRRRPGKRTKAPTAAQRQQQVRFRTLQQFLLPFQEILKFSFYDWKKRRTGYNMAFRENYRVAIAGSYPELYVDPSLVKIAHGSIRLPYRLRAGSELPGRIDFSWARESDHGDLDKAVLVAYCEERREVIYTIGAMRYAGWDALFAPAFSGLRVATYIFFTDGKGRVSDSQYLGMVGVATEPDDVDNPLPVSNIFTKKLRKTLME
ncbi:MAG TPA: DUF6266 family protein [Puia sp.]|nr:DUF6266 family protein [Puia sp.]